MSEKLKLKDLAYWTTDDSGEIIDGPFCTECWETSRSKFRIFPREKEPMVQCSKCKNEFASTPLFHYLRPDVEETRKKLIEKMRNQNQNRPRIDYLGGRR